MRCVVRALRCVLCALLCVVRALLCVVRALRCVLRALLCAVRALLCVVRPQKAVRDHIHKEDRKTYAELVEGVNESWRCVAMRRKCCSELSYT